MAYDEVLAERLRFVLEGEPGLSEKKMFGGLAFLVDGHMAVAAGSQGAMMLRADPEASADLLAVDGIAPMEMRGRPMAGWLLVDQSAVADDADLARYAARGVAHARTSSEGLGPLTEARPGRGACA